MLTLLINQGMQNQYTCIYEGNLSRISVTAHEGKITRIPSQPSQTPTCQLMVSNVSIFSGKDTHYKYMLHVHATYSFNGLDTIMLPILKVCYFQTPHIQTLIHRMVSSSLIATCAISAQHKHSLEFVIQKHLVNYGIYIDIA